MKYRAVRIVLLSSILIVLLVAYSAIAETKPRLPSVDLWAEWYTVPGFSLSKLGFPEGAKIVKVNSSQRSVLDYDYDATGLCLLPRKVGKSKITLTYKVGNKKSSIAKTYKVLPYPNPITSIKVDGKKINLRENKASVYFGNYKKTKTTITVKPSTGWKIVKRATYTDEEGVTTIRSLKNIKLSKKFSRINIEITLRNTKGQEYVYGVQYER